VALARRLSPAAGGRPRRISRVSGGSGLPDEGTPPARVRAEVVRLERERAALAEKLARLRAHATIARTHLHSMQDSKFWKLRNAWFDLKRRAGLHPLGAQPFVDLPLEEIDDTAPAVTAYEHWLRENEVRDADRRLIGELVAVLPRTPLISVLMPVYEPPERYLRAALDSVIDQLYPHWQLCVADDASPSPHVRAVLREYAARDPRIEIVFRATNGHIAATSNSALALARGEIVALLDHDDELTPDALFHVALLLNRHPDADVIYSDEDKIDDAGHRRDPYFKPDWSPDSFLGRMYTGHLAAFRRELVEAAGGFRTGFEGSQDYDLMLRVTERTGRIHHIPRVLYHWRMHEASTAHAGGAKDYAFAAGRRALAEALDRRGEPGRVEQLPDPGSYLVRYEIRTPEPVSIIVPTRDHAADVERCLSSIFARSTYPHFEVVLVDNGSTDPAALATFAQWSAREPRVRVVRYDVPFNFSRINNYAVERSTGRYLLFLNNDTEVLVPDWIEAMVEQAQRPSVGAVGAKLLYPDGTIQHAGVVLRIGGVAGHSHKYSDGAAHGYFNMLRTVNNYSAVTGACMMIRREVFEAAGGFDEALAVAFNDVDLCLRLRAAGLYNVYLPHVVLYHHESKSRGHENTPDKRARFAQESVLMQRRWRTAELDDPHYSPHLSVTTEDYAIRL
jgi:GT2 family glycosyltransferase